MDELAPIAPDFGARRGCLAGTAKRGTHSTEKATAQYMRRRLLILIKPSRADGPRHYLNERTAAPLAGA